MKLYDGGRAPNPRRVRVFLAEKGISVPLVPVDMGAMGHKGEEMTAAIRCSGCRCWSWTTGQS